MIYVVGVPVLNEEQHMKLFCERHSFAEKIIVCDGGSTDKTVEIASSFPNVEVIHFEEKTPVLGAPYGFVNHEGHEIKFLLDKIKSFNPDWITMYGADQFPNPQFFKNARKILEETKEDSIFVFTLYRWRNDKYFPKMFPLDWRCLWAWRNNPDTYYTDEIFQISVKNLPATRRDIGPPLAIVHNFCPDEETVQLKLQRYEALGMKQVHPLEWEYAPPRKLPRWAKKW